MNVTRAGNGVIVSAVLNVLVASTIIEDPILMLPGKLFNVSVPPFITFIVDNIKPVKLFDVARIITPLFIIIAPIGWGVATGIENILVVESVCVHAPPLIVMVAAPELP